MLDKAHTHNSYNHNHILPLPSNTRSVYLTRYRPLPGNTRSLYMSLYIIYIIMGTQEISSLQFLNLSVIMMIYTLHYDVIQ